MLKEQWWNDAGTELVPSEISIVDVRKAIEQEVHDFEAMVSNNIFHGAKEITKESDKIDAEIRFCLHIQAIDPNEGIELDNRLDRAKQKAFDKLPYTPR